MPIDIFFKILLSSQATNTFTFGPSKIGFDVKVSMKLEKFGPTVSFNATLCNSKQPGGIFKHSPPFLHVIKTTKNPADFGWALMDAQFL